MNFVVEAWAPAYGAPTGGDALEPSDAKVDTEVEVSPARWAPLLPVGAPAACVAFVDGVRRVDARVWFMTAEGAPRPGVCASYAAGFARCDSVGRVEAARVERGVFARAGAPHITTSAGAWTPRTVAGDADEDLVAGVQQRMRDLEIAVARTVRGADLVVVDGPLRERQDVSGAVGYVKTHRVSYLPAVVSDVVAALGPGQRTPVFAMTTTWSRFSWYLRLPGARGHPWAGVVRVEASADLTVPDVRALADRTAATLPRFASAAYKDPRAPQNLYPIAALEQQLRRRLGDPALIERRLRAAAG